MKYKEDYYMFHQTDKHLKILEADGMILNNGLDEYHLQSKGLRVLDDIETLGYLARHKIAAAEAEMKEEEQDERDDTVLTVIHIVIWLIVVFNLDGCFK